MSFVGAAATVVARLFRLINPQGEVVGEFDSAAQPPTYGFTLPALVLHHNNIRSSYLAWTRNSEATPNITTLLGPSALADATDPPEVTLVGGAGSNYVDVRSDLVYVRVNGITGQIELNPNQSGAGILLNTRAGALLTFLSSDVATAGAQNILIAAAAVTGLTVAVTNSIIGDLIVVHVTLVVSRNAVVDPTAIAIGTVSCTNVSANPAPLPVVRFTDVNDCMVMSWTQLFTVNANGTCTVGVNVSSSANNEFAIVRDWSAMTVQRFSSN